MEQEEKQEEKLNEGSSPARDSFEEMTQRMSPSMNYGQNVGQGNGLNVGPNFNPVQNMNQGQNINPGQNMNQGQNMNLGQNMNQGQNMNLGQNMNQGQNMNLSQNVNLGQNMNPGQNINLGQNMNSQMNPNQGRDENSYNYKTGTLSQSQIQSQRQEKVEAYKEDYIKREKKSSFGKGIVLGFLCCILISTGCFLWYISSNSKKDENKPEKISTDAVVVEETKQTTETEETDETHYTLTTDESGSSITEREDTNYAGIVNDELTDKMEYIMRVIDQYYYLTPVTEDEMEEGIYKGILESLGDPYSVYYTKEELDDLMQDTSGIYFGIGAYVSLDEDTKLPKISGIIEGTPAEAAGLHSDDLIYTVDGVEVYGYELSDAVALIRGPEGTDVTLQIIRDGEMDYLTFVVTRAKVESPTVKYKDLGDGIAYIQITQFDTITVSQFNEAVEQAKANGMQKLVLDLRDNPGGSLSAVVDIADTLLPEGLVVYTEDKNGNRDEYRSDADCIDVPMVCLVNGNSASASEILSGAIKDYQWGTLIGTTTYGKGIVQQIIPFNDGTGIKLTISSYFTPNGNNIHGTGIVPDVELELDKDAYYAEESVDNQLEEAIKYLKEQN